MYSVAQRLLVMQRFEIHLYNGCPAETGPCSEHCVRDLHTCL